MFAGADSHFIWETRAVGQDSERRGHQGGSYNKHCSATDIRLRRYVHRRLPIVYVRDSVCS